MEHESRKEIIELWDAFADANYEDLFGEIF